LCVYIDGYRLYTVYVKCEIEWKEIRENNQSSLLDLLPHSILFLLFLLFLSPQDPIIIIISSLHYRMTSAAVTVADAPCPVTASVNPISVLSATSLIITAAGRCGSLQTQREREERGTKNYFWRFLFPFIESRKGEEKQRGSPDLSYSAKQRASAQQGYLNSHRRRRKKRTPMPPRGRYAIHQTNKKRASDSDHNTNAIH
jgi:hypothetical protein